MLLRLRRADVAAAVVGLSVVGQVDLLFLLWLDEVGVGCEERLRLGAEAGM